VLVFTVQPGLRHTYHSVLHDRKAVKTYEAIAPWRADLLWPHTRTDRLEEKPGAAFMQMQVVSGEPNAQTRIEVLEVLKPGVSSDAASTLARYRLSPLTGRKHQLRVHMNELGLPIVGDRIYPQLLPDLAPGALPDYSRPLQLLAREFAFTDPVTGQERRFTSRQSLQVGR
jgi:tRNA pseudouridine32 synthase/23S rRNA pseudouridine746 synthase